MRDPLHLQKYIRNNRAQTSNGYQATFSPLTWPRNAVSLSQGVNLSAYHGHQAMQSSNDQVSRGSYWPQ